MRKVFVLSIFLASCLLITTFAIAEDDKEAGPPALKIGFSESYNPYPNFTLTGMYSDLKTYLQNEFGATVTAVTGGWSNLSQYDVFIIPTRYQGTPSQSACVALRNWIQAGGVCIILWYPYNISDPGDYWYGDSLHNFVLEFFGLGCRASPAGSHDMTTIAAPYNNTPYQINKVSGAWKTGWVLNTSGAGKYLGWSPGGQTVASYNPNAGQGSIFLLGNMYPYQNTRIDQDDNKNFMFNIIHNATGNGGGGGGGGGKPDLWPKKVKGRPRTVDPGDQFKVLCRVKNKGKADAGATKVYFYLSPDEFYDASDIELGSVDLPALKKKKSKKVKKTFLIPLTTPAGTYYLVVVVDKDDNVDESDETNNEKAYNKTIEVQ